LPGYDVGTETGFLSRGWYLVKLVSYREQEETRLGVTQAGKIGNLRAAAMRFAEATDSEVPESAFATMDDLLAASDGTLETAGGIAAWALEHAPDVIVDLETAEIDIPLANPGKIICIGLNYADHCRETNTPVPDSPVLFAKFTTATTRRCCLGRVTR
jgi:acylpyruvate hydrolase